MHYDCGVTNPSHERLSLANTVAQTTSAKDRSRVIKNVCLYNSAVSHIYGEVWLFDALLSRHIFVPISILASLIEHQQTILYVSDIPTHHQLNILKCPCHKRQSTGVPTAVIKTLLKSWQTAFAFRTSHRHG